LAVAGKFWKTRTHYLDRMTMAELIRAYFLYPAIEVYLALIAASLALAYYWHDSFVRLLVVALVVIAIYPMVEYLLHRFVLHGSYLYKSPLTAALWKRIHFDHHQDPHNLEVLFGTFHTTLPPIVLITWPIGYAIDGRAGAAMAFGFGLIMLCFYEFCHCVQHLGEAPKSAYLQRIKRLHLAHHFHNETGNFGITSHFWDHILGTFYGKAKERPRSETVFNLGYTEKTAERYPWVARLTGEAWGKDPRTARRQSAPEPN
jgi:sterol desaturase/sphingolipid hydroxylase (fatty acid hydroxylase superfamily)